MFNFLCFLIFWNWFVNIYFISLIGSLFIFLRYLDCWLILFRRVIWIDFIWNELSIPLDVLSHIIFLIVMLFLHKIYNTVLAIEIVAWIHRVNKICTGHSFSSIKNIFHTAVAFSFLPRVRKCLEIHADLFGLKHFNVLCLLVIFFWI